MSVRFSTFKKRLAGDVASRVHAILMLGEMKSRLGEAVEVLCAYYDENSISFAEYAAFRRGLASPGWQAYHPLLVALGAKVHPRLVAILHDAVLAPRVLAVMMESGGENGVRSALGHAPHLVSQLLSGEPKWRRLALDGLGEGLARRSLADEDGPGGVVAFLVDFARYLAQNPDENGLREELSKALKNYRPGLFPEVAAWWEIAEALSEREAGLAVFARGRGESAYRDLLKTYRKRPRELPIHYIRDLALCADTRALPLLKALMASNSEQGTWDDNGGSGEPRWIVPFPGAEELHRRLLATVPGKPAKAKAAKTSKKAKPTKTKPKAKPAPAKARVRSGKGSLS